MGRLMVSVVLLAAFVMVDRCLANVVPVPLATSQSQKGDCMTYILEGKGDFKLQRKVHSVQNADFVIVAMHLVRRTSFYKCEPRNTKYGTGADQQTWWVDRGCEGIFEVTECPASSNAFPKEALRGAAYSNTMKNVDDAIQTVDLNKWNVNGVANRFEIRRQPFVRSS